jgi:hypothetical protein
LYNVLLANVFFGDESEKVGFKPCLYLFVYMYFLLDCLSERVDLVATDMSSSLARMFSYFQLSLRHLETYRPW